MLMLLQQGALGELSPTMQVVTPQWLAATKTCCKWWIPLLRFTALKPVAKSDLLTSWSKKEFEVAKELSPLAMKMDCHLDFGEHKALSKVMGDRLELHRLFTNLVEMRLVLRMLGSHNPPETYFCPSDGSRNEQSGSYTWLSVEDEPRHPGRRTSHLCLKISPEAMLFR